MRISVLPAVLVCMAVLSSCAGGSGHDDLHEWNRARPKREDPGMLHADFSELFDFDLGWFFR